MCMTMHLIYQVYLVHVDKHPMLPYLTQAIACMLMLQMFLQSFEPIIVSQLTHLLNLRTHL